LGDAEAVRVEINMAAGELDVAGGADGLLEADFTYNVAELKPQVEYRGRTLTVSTPDVDVGTSSLWDLDDYRYEWDLRLNDDVAMEMSVGVGAGNTWKCHGGSGRCFLADQARRWDRRWQCHSGSDRQLAG
jgi:hypothetical protein